MIRDQFQEINGSRARWRVTCGAAVDFGAEHPGLLQAAFLDPVFIAPRDDNVGGCMIDGHLVASRTNLTMSQSANQPWLVWFTTARDDLCQ